MSVTSITQPHSEECQSLRPAQGLPPSSAINTHTACLQGRARKAAIAAARPSWAAVPVTLSVSLLGCTEIRMS